MRLWKRKRKSEESTESPPAAKTNRGPSGFPSSTNPLTGFPVILFDGSNHEAIVNALHIKEGDGVIVLSDKEAIIARQSQLDAIRLEMFKP